MYIPQKEYDNILEQLCIVCVDVLIVHNNQCLLVERINEPAKGLLWFPGGRIRKMELINNAALRKAKEEINIDCNFKKIVSVEETIFPKKNKMITDIHTINLCCLMEPLLLDNIILDNLHSNYIWISLADVYRLKLHDAVRNPVLKVLH